MPVCLSVCHLSIHLPTYIPVYQYCSPDLLLPSLNLLVPKATNTEFTVRVPDQLNVLHTYWMNFAAFPLLL